MPVSVVLTLPQSHQLALTTLDYVTVSSGSLLRSLSPPEAIHSLSPAARFPGFICKVPFSVRGTAWGLEQAAHPPAPCAAHLEEGCSTRTEVTAQWASPRPTPNPIK